MGDDSIFMVILDIDSGYHVALTRADMSFHPEGKSCGLVRYRLEYVFSMTLLPGAGDRQQVHPRGVHRHAQRSGGACQLLLPTSWDSI
jgi:hypothetical protein